MTGTPTGGLRSEKITWREVNAKMRLHSLQRTLGRAGRKLSRKEALVCSGPPSFAEETARVFAIQVRAAHVRRE